MFVTVITVHRGQSQVQQIEAPTLKDCLVAWAGRLIVEGTTDEAQTRLRGNMADFDQPPVEGFRHLWRFQSDLGLGGEPEARIYVIETIRM
jgi:hypothetical protein